MRRMSTRLAAVAAGLTLPAVAVAQDVDRTAGAIQPADVAGTTLKASSKSILIMQENAGSPFANASPTLQIDVLDSTGTSIIAPNPLFDAAGSAGISFIDGVDVNAGGAFDAVAPDALTVNLANVPGLSFALGDPNAATIRLIIDDGTNPAVNVDFQLVKNRPTLTQAFLDTTPTPNKLFLIFSETINNTNAANDANQTVLANITGAPAEFENADDAAFSVNLSDLDNTEIANPTLVATAPQRNVLSLDVNAGVLAVGNFIRYKDAAVDDMKDITGLEVTNAGVQIQAIQAPAITGAKWVKTVANNGAAVAGALRVDFNQTVGAAGNLAFWQNVVMGNPTTITNTSDCAGAPCLQITAVDALDPNFPNSVFLTVTANAAGTDTVEADGLTGPTSNLSPTAFGLSLDASVGTPPSDFLGTAITGTPTVTAIGDGIAPTDTSAPMTADLNNDGKIDAFKINMSEPLASGATAAGFTLTKLNNVVVHPIDKLLANLPGNTNLADPANQATVLADGMNDTFTPTTFSLQSEDATDRLMTNNVLVIQFDPDAVDWDDDGNAGAADADGEAFPGTGDLNFATVAITAATSGVADPAGNGFDADLGTAGVQDFAAANVSVDMANPLVVEAQFVTADNIDNTGVQIGVETDGAAAVAAKPVPGQVGDQTNNNEARLITTENVANMAVDPTKFIFGNQPTERFQAGDFVAVTNNSVRFRDNTSGGYSAGDTLTIATGNGIDDGAGDNELRGLNNNPLTVTDRSAPYIQLQTDINGNTIQSAFVSDTNNDGFADQARLIFNKNLDASTVQNADFSFANPSLSIVGTVAVNGSVVTINFTDGVEVFNSSLEVVITIAGNSGIADANGNALENVAATPVVAQPVPEPANDGQFMGVMDISGTITGPDGNLVPAGTQVFGMFVVPVAKEIIITVDGLTFSISDTLSLEAVTNVILGVESEAFLISEDPIEEGNEMVIRNDKDAEGSGTRVKGRLSINVKSLSSVSFTLSGGAKGNGTIRMSWDVGRSNAGDVDDFFANGQDFGDDAIVSAAVVTGDTGSYLLHMTAPTGAFNGFMSAVGRPVIMVVVLPTGERFPVSGLLNKISGGGPLLFQPMNRSNSPAATTFNIDLQEIARRDLFPGWNGLADDRDFGFATASSTRPILPRGVSSANVQLGTSLPNATALSHYVYYNESAAPADMWTSADDFGDFFDSLVIDVNCVDYVAFTATSRGVQVATDSSPGGITAIVGGYATGFFTTNRLGVFQFGMGIATGSSVFSASDPFPNSNTTLGWGFLTNTTGAQANPGSFLTANGFDFAIFFTHDATGVNITTLGPGGSGDTVSVPAGAAFFGHTP